MQALQEDLLTLVHTVTHTWCLKFRMTTLNTGVYSTLLYEYMYVHMYMHGLSTSCPTPFR